MRKDVQNERYQYKSKQFSLKIFIMVCCKLIDYQEQFEGIAQLL